MTERYTVGAGLPPLPSQDQIAHGGGGLPGSGNTVYLGGGGSTEFTSGAILSEETKHEIRDNGNAVWLELRINARDAGVSVEKYLRALLNTAVRDEQDTFEANLNEQRDLG